MSRIALLKHVWHEALPYQEQPLTAPVTPAQLSSDVLTHLASLLHQYSLQGNPQGRQACPGQRQTALASSLWSAQIDSVTWAA